MAPQTTSNLCRCKSCNTAFRTELPTNVPVEEWVAALYEVRCPSCGAGTGQLGIGANLSQEEDMALRIDGPADVRAANWHDRAEIGASAVSLYRYFLSGSTEGLCVPDDLSALRRCIRLLEHVPEWTERMSELSADPKWGWLAANWPRVVDLFRAEAPTLTGPAPGTQLLLAELSSEEPL
ncbi:hypothetical protein [Sphingosinicella sp. BN140058]|uniref:hypothetical protein n=1 Tax=Sphingosinicella sp. BN140058 TaxID=1892855 RepID=UPI0013E9E23E|nr:hypothetical protein [Sphingosinicella sp. BN140058]